MNHQKRILAINDISCFGKCSLTAAIPILSAAGIETCALPTAVLSTHTAFSGYTFRDLTEDLLPQAQHWASLGLTFDGIYTGYLGSLLQVDAVETILDMFKTPFVLVDPVMGDNGKLYAGFDASYVEEMKRLVKRADIIVPNITEGAMLAGVPYEAGEHTTCYIQVIIEKLQALCAGNIVLTGIHMKDGVVGTAVWDKNALSVIEQQRFDVFYSGTGDVFASALAAAIMLGYNIKKAAELAAVYVETCILETRKTSGDRNYGLNFEPCIKQLLQVLEGGL